MATNKSIQFRGKKSVLKQFESLKMPVYRLYNIDEQKSPFSKYEGKSIPAALKEFSDVLDNIEPAGIYILDAFYPANTKEDKNYHLPDAQIIFTLEEKQRVSGLKDKDDDTVQRTSIYSPEFEDHIKLIKQNAELKAERDYFSKVYNESIDEIARLNQEIKVKDEELDSIEEEEEEDNVNGVPEQENFSWNKIIGQFVQKHGDKVVDALLAKKLINPGNIATATTAINGSDEELNKIIEDLKKHDPKLQRHLYLLLQVAIQDKSMFDTVLNQLEALFKTTE